MKVLFFSNEFPGPHDPNRAVFNLRMCEAIARRHEVTVVAPVPWTDLFRGKGRRPVHHAYSSIEATYPVYYFVPKLLSHLRGVLMWLSVARTLRAVVRRWRPDVVLAYWTFPDGEVAGRIAREIGVPVVQIVGGSDILLARRTGRRWAHVRQVLGAADHVLTIGRDLADRLVEVGVPNERVTSVYRPVRRELFSPGGRSEARARLYLPAESPIALWVGRFVEVKGLKTLVEALGLLRRVCPCLLLCLVGDGPQLPEIREAVSARQLSDVVRFVGPVPNTELVHWYRAANVTVLPSLSEGIPNVLLESITCGTPFVASRVGGIPEIADPHLDSLVPPGVPEALAAALAEHLVHQRPSRPRAFIPATFDEFNQSIDAVLSHAIRARSTLRESA